MPFRYVLRCRETRRDPGVDRLRHSVVVDTSDPGSTFGGDPNGLLINTNAYIDFLAGRGVPRDVAINELTAQQFNALTNGIRVYEGFRPGTVTWRPTRVPL
jgi:hypothetical protein